MNIVKYRKRISFILKITRKTGNRNWFRLIFFCFTLNFNLIQAQTLHVKSFGAYPDDGVDDIVHTSCSQNIKDIKSPVDNKNWELFWQDNFDYENREQLLEVWESQNGPSSHILCSRWKENIQVGNGVVRLVNRKESRGGKDWTSGNIWTKEEFMYGYFECRYRYASSAGTNNSFWLMTQHGAPDPEEGKRYEIDINEGHYPNEINTNIHNWTDISYNSDGKRLHPTSHKSFEFANTDFSKDFHTYGLEWNENELIFYLDGEKIRRVNNDFCVSPSPIRLSLAIIKWAGEVSDITDGTFMEIDYVRVYKKRDEQ
jgi:beta-glucanase (GH16 family)